MAVKKNEEGVCATDEPANYQLDLQFPDYCLVSDPQLYSSPPDLSSFQWRPKTELKGMKTGLRLKQNVVLLKSRSKNIWV